MGHDRELARHPAGAINRGSSSARAAGAIANATPRGSAEFEATHVSMELSSKLKGADDAPGSHPTLDPYENLIEAFDRADFAPPRDLGAAIRALPGVGALPPPWESRTLI